MAETSWPADKVERWPISRLTPYEKNARTHSPDQIDQIAASIREWGWTMPILVDEEGGIIAGHARAEAAKKVGLTEVPVMVAAGWSKKHKRAYIIADNKLTINGGCADDILRAELSELRDLDFNLSLTGFSDTELADLLTEPPAGLTDPDEAPDPPQTPVSRRGDVWILGRHRLVCGDATDASDVALALNGVQPHLMVTDPPYGVDYDARWRLNAMPEKNTVNGSHGRVENDERADWTDAWSLFPGEVVYVWHAGVHSAETQQAFANCGFKVRAQIIWAKHQSVIGRGHYHVQHEPCFYLVRRGSTGHWQGDRKQHTLWQIDKPLHNETGHSTQKPVECMRRPIENNSSPGHAIYDPFSGSGTTIIAAEMTARSCHALEIAPEYCDVAVERWRNFTGKQATLESTGQTYEEVAAERLSEPPP